MKHRLMHGLVVLSVIALAACSDTAGPDGTDSQLESLLTLDVAMVSADALIEDLAELQLAFGGGLGGAFAAPLDRVRTVTYYDADGNEQEAYDEVTTASGSHRERDHWRDGARELVRYHLTDEGHHGHGS